MVFEIIIKINYSKVSLTRIVWEWKKTRRYELNYTIQQLSRVSTFFKIYTT